MFQGFGTILLVPSLIRQINMEQNVSGDEQDCRLTVVHGAQFLALAAVGAANIVGRIAGYGLSKFLSFRVLNSIVSLLIAVCYGVVIWYDDMVTVIVTMTAGKFLYAITMNDTNIRIAYNQSFYGSAKFAVGSAITVGAGFAGAVAGAVLAAFFPASIPVTVTCVSGLCQVAIVLSFWEL